MPSRRKPKPSVKAKERAEPHFGGRKRAGTRKPRKPQALKSPDRPSRRAASDFFAEIERQARDRDRRAVLPPACQGEPVTPLVGRYTSTRKTILANTWRESSSSHKTFKLHPDQKEIVEAALAHAKQKSGTKHAPLAFDRGRWD